MTVRIKASSVHFVQTIEEGVFEISLPSVEISPEASELLNTLFPDLGSPVRKLLGKQALLNAMK